MIVEPIKTRFCVSDAPLAFEKANRAAIDAYWGQRLAANGRLWNGPFFLFTDVALDRHTLVATAHQTDFATFLYHRHVDRGVDHGLVHITGTSLPVTSDGVIVAMEMAAHTANAGHIYFPAGSFDPKDIVAGHLDPMTNVCRELAEETGIIVQTHEFQPEWIGVFDDDTWHVAIPSVLPMTFAQCQEQLRAHQSSGGDDELARFVPVRNGDDAAVLRPFARKLADHMLAKMGW